MEQLHIILDPSALVGGIGQIKKWSQEKELELYIPSYTLHELDFIKKGVSLLATNARESIRFIDRATSWEDQYFEEDEAPKQPLKSKVSIENPDEAGPNWSKCVSFRKRSPRLRDFPNHKADLHNSLLTMNHNTPSNLRNSGRNARIRGSNPTSVFPAVSEAEALEKGLDVFELQQGMVQSGDQRAEMPLRLRYLIRSCIHKTFIENAGQKWLLCCEDPVTSIWCRSFGIDVIDLGMLTHIMESEDGSLGDLNHLTFVENLDQPREPPRREHFDETIYASRGQGKLWRP